ncbi:MULTISPECIES: OmpA family protein [unclassified Acinetobacter]|uniref:OmpA family protein n=1 Tax=unclassified Acinetobacter TaxID=196816 RepID=UPI00190D30E7|nr:MULTISPECIES: OmpA family protein [unclassified Acinetobacter]MBK0064225.1 OmpA family protein [Acinetobacter sp. S55]MBK0067583.1 OmpA family protein [Acinetobacter sp. S54]
MTSNFNPLELLAERVTPLVVDQTQLEIDIDKKSSLLKQFYPIILSLFHKFPDRLNGILHGSQAPLQELLGNHQGVLNEILDAFSKHHSLQPATIESLFNHAIPLSARALKEEVGEGNIVSYIGSYLPQIASQLPAWAAPILSGLGLGSLFHTAAPTAQPLKTPPADTGGGFKKFLPWLALIILALLLLFFWRSCQKQTPETHTVAESAATSEAVSPAATAPASLSLTSGTGNQVLGCQSNVGDSGLASLLQAGIAKVFGASANCNIATDSTYATQLPAQEKLDTILNLVKGVPNASIEWVGDQLTVNAPDATALKDLIDKIKAAAPELNVVSAAPLNVEQSVNNSINASTQALSGLNESSNPEQILRALNMQIINFASGSAAIPDANKAVLDHAAGLLQKVPNLSLNVEGYTDSTGNAEANKVLSQKRAQAVVDYLTGKGVNGSSLKAVGYGSENPVADNETEQGKFRNRRIEFKLAGS